MFLVLEVLFLFLSILVFVLFQKFLFFRSLVPILLFKWDGVSPIFEVFVILLNSRSSHVSVPILMAFTIILRYLVYSRSSVVSFVCIFRSFVPSVPILMAFYIFLRYLVYSRSSNVRFVHICERFVSILFLFKWSFRLLPIPTSV